MSLFRLKAKGQSLGLDRGTFSTKAVSLEKRGLPLRVSSMWSTSPDEGSVRLQVQSSRLNGSLCALSLPDEKVDRSEYNFTGLPEKEIETAVRWKMQTAGIPVDQISFDTVHSHSGKNTKTVCISATKDVVQEARTFLEEADLKASSLEPQSSAIAAYVEALTRKKNGTYAVLDLGYSAFRILFILEGEVVLSRTLYFGMSTLCQRASSEIQLPPSDVLDLLVECQKLDSLTPMHEQTLRIFDETLYLLCEEYQKTEISFQDRFGGRNEVSTIYLCGGAACFPKAVAYLKKHLSERPVECLDPIAQISNLPEGIDKCSGPAWVAAIGLALRELA